MTWEKANNNSSIKRRINENSFTISCLLALFIRIVIILLVDSYVEADVNSWPIFLKYSDVDYKIFLQAAAFVSKGLSPFARQTYRYTPLLSWLLSFSLSWRSVGKILFCTMDLVVAKVLREMFCCSCLGISVWWLFNPFVIVIGTRGSADSIVCALSLLSIGLLGRNAYFVAGFFYGLAVHFKLYPIIFCIPILGKLNGKFSSLQKFVLGSVVSFCGLGVLFFRFYGWEFVYQAYLYHFIRKDHRHNFSPFFYPIYMQMKQNSKLEGLAALIPSIGSWLSAGALVNDLNLACFVQTCLFVIFNKVITAQYYLWILCWFPLVVRVNLRNLIWYGCFLGIHALWNYLANLLENAGKNMFFEVWLVSLVNFVFCVASLCIFLQTKTKASYFKRD
jgi:phosphatidylinositol glycan class M